MTTATKTLSSTVRSATRNAPISSSARFAFPRQPFQNARRFNSTASWSAQSASRPVLQVSIASLLLGGGIYAAHNARNRSQDTSRSNLRNTSQLESRSSQQHNNDDTQSQAFVPTQDDYQKVYDAVAQKLIDEDEYDDGSYGPVVLRLGFHCSGTYDAETGTGGSNGATMRFAPESEHGANSGLKAARDFLEPIKAQFPWITYSDLWTLAASCAVQEMGGPDIPWRPGRSDRDVAWCTPDGRLPDGSKKQDHIRAIFVRMGFNDQEMVALIGAHALGRCHVERSGFDGPWTFSPTMLTNDYYKLLIDEDWEWKQWHGQKQYTDKTTKSLMMLPADMALVQDEGFKPFVRKYADDQDLFFEDFSNAICKMFELGVPFHSGEDARMEFKRLE